MKYLEDEFIGERQIHLSTVLTPLRQNAPLSRAALADITGLNRVTITRFLRDLIEHGFVREAGFQSVRAGHPSILLQLDPEAVLLGAALSRRDWYGAVCERV